MPVLQKTLEIAMKPLLNERYQKGQEQGWEEKQQEWESWLKRQQESVGFTWNDNDPPPSGKYEREG